MGADLCYIEMSLVMRRICQEVGAWVRFLDARALDYAKSAHIFLQAALEAENLKAYELAYDRPSLKLLEFLDRHYGMPHITCDTCPPACLDRATSAFSCASHI